MAWLSLRTHDSGHLTTVGRNSSTSCERSSDRSTPWVTSEVSEEPMARRAFEMIDLNEIYLHWYAGRSQGQIAVGLGMDRKTVRKAPGASCELWARAGGRQR